MEIQETLKKIDLLLHKQHYNKVADILQEMIDVEIEKQQKVEELVTSCSLLYDKLYYYIIFGKIPSEKKTIRQLETLAMPFQSKTEEERKVVLEKMRKENT